MTDICSSNTPGTTVNSAILVGSVPGVPGPEGPAGCPQISSTRVIEAPAAGRHYIEFFNTATTIDKVVVLLKGTAPTVTYNIRQGLDFTGLGTALLGADRTDTNVSTGAVLEPVDFVASSNDLLASSHLWVDVTSVTADSLIIAVVYSPTCEDSIANRGVPIEDTGIETSVIPLEDIV